MAFDIGDGPFVPRLILSNVVADLGPDR